MPRQKLRMYYYQQLLDRILLRGSIEVLSFDELKYLAALFEEKLTNKLDIIDGKSSKTKLRLADISK